MDTCRLFIECSQRAKRRRFKVVKISPGLTIKPDRVLELKIFKILGGYTAIF